MLRAQLRVPCVLALTATATALTCRAVMQTLGIPPQGLVGTPVTRQNLVISCSRDENREEALLRLLRMPGFREATSIIIYTMYQVRHDDGHTFS